MALVSACIQGGGETKKRASGEGSATDPKDGDPNASKTKKKDSCLWVINGKNTTQYPSVGLLAELDPENVIGGTCSGTFIGPNAMITAAHCITFGSETEMVYLKGSNVDTGETIEQAKAVVAGGIKPKKVIVKATELQHGNLKDDLIDMNISYKDMAVLIFADDIAPAVTNVLNRDVKDREAATIVGFGATASDVRTAKAGEASIKRVGKNHVVIRTELKDQFPDLLIMFGRGDTTDTSGNATDSLSGAGDSGGPIFINGAVAGVVSNGAAAKEVQDLATQLGEKGDNMTVYPSLQSAYALDIFKDAKAAGAKIQFGAGGSDSTTPGTGTGTDTGSCLVGDDDDSGENIDE